MHIVFTGIILNRMTEAFTRMLLHSLWQGIVFAVFTCIVLLFTKKTNAATRYNILLIMFSAFLFTCLLTFIWQWNNVYYANTAIHFDALLNISVSQLFTGEILYINQLLNNISEYCTGHSVIIAVIWFVIFSFRIIKMMSALLYNRQIKTWQVFEPDMYWCSILKKLSFALGIDKAVVLLESGYLKMPAVAGHLKPVILIPLGLLASLPAEQVEAVLLHELAHIRRNDYLVNIFQYIAETIFFFNPAVLWISSLLREERENCCDDIALGQTKNKEGLIQALISFKQYQLSGYSFTTSFIGKKNQLFKRAVRILDQNNTAATFPVRLFSFAGIVLLFIAGAFISPALLHKQLKAEFRVFNNDSKLSAKKIIIADNAFPEVVNNHKISAVKKAVFIKRTVKQYAAAAEEESIFLDEAKVDLLNQEPAQGMKEDQQRAKLMSEKAFIDQQQAKKDEVQAMRDQHMAMLDQQQAKIDEVQGTKDEQQAKIDQEQAMKDQHAAKLMQEKSMQDQLRAKTDQENAIKQKKEAERIKVQH